MSPAAQLFHARIERRAAALAPELRRALLRAYARLAKVLTETQMEVFIRDPSALRLLELEAEIQKALAPASRALRDGVEAAGQAVAKELPGAAQGTTFNVLNPKVLAAIRDLDRRVMGAITTEVQGVVRAVVERGLQEGIGPRAMARMVQSSVGLAENQVKALGNFRKMLEEGNAEVLTRTLRDRRFDAMIKRAFSAMDRSAAEPGRIWYHGTPADVLSSTRVDPLTGKSGWFIASKGETGVPLVWGTSDPFTAEGYTRGSLDLSARPDKFGKLPLVDIGVEPARGGVYSLRSKVSTRIFTYDAGGKSWFQIGQGAIIQRAKAEGYDAVVFTNIVDNYDSNVHASDVIAWMDSSKIELAPDIPRSGLTPDQVDKMVVAYRNRMAAFHAETITRTAALDAQRVGHQLTWEDAVARGDINGETLTKRWSGTLDDRERDTHLIMEGETVPYDQPYSNGQMVPGEGEYNCRCVSIFETRGKLKPGAGKRGITAKQLRVGPALAGVA